MGNYYLIAQLPFLRFEQKPAITSEQFLQETKKWLNEQEMIYLQQAVLNCPVINKEEIAVQRQYKQFEQQLREAMAVVRRQIKSGSAVKIPEQLSYIFDADTPWHKEKNFLHSLWKFIDTLEIGHHFDLEFLVLYYLKLQILERLNLFKKEKGFAVFERIMENTIQTGKI